MNAGGQYDESSSRRRPSLALLCAILAAVMLLALPLFLAWGYNQHGAAGLQAAAVAVGVCWICATAALVVSGLFVGTSQSLNASLGSIGLQTGLPILIGVVLDSQIPVLAEAGVMGMMLAAFLVALAAKTLLVLWLIGPVRPPVAKAL